MIVEEILKIAKKVMERHKKTFQKLAEHDTQIVEKTQIMNIPAKPDDWARKHSIASRKQAQDDLASHKELINNWLQAQSSQLKAIDEELDKANHLSSLLAKDCHDRIQRLENRVRALEAESKLKHSDITSDDKSTIDPI